MVKHIALIALALLFATPLAAKAQLPYAANPAAKDTPKTPPRDWKATNGKTLKAIATAYDGTTVTLLDAYRRKIPLPASRLVPDDIAYLEDFFPPPKPAHIPGQPSGPVKLTNGAAYIGYIPSSYNPRGKHPLLVYMGNEPAEENNVVRFQSALQAHKWCWIGIRPGIREQETETYHVLIQRCVKDAIAKMPVDPRRVYYCGTTSAAAQAIHTTQRARGAGALLSSPFERWNERLTLPRKDFVIASRATSAFRYPAAEFARLNGGKRTTRLLYHADGFPHGPRWMVEDSLLWLDARYLARATNADATRRAAFERHVLQTIKGYQEFMNYRTYEWARFMTTPAQWPLSEENKPDFEALLTELGDAPEVTQYADALAAISDFAYRYYAPHARKEKDPVYNHTAPDIQKAVKTLHETYPQSQMMDEVIPLLDDRTPESPRKVKAREEAAAAAEKKKK